MIAEDPNKRSIPYASEKDCRDFWRAVLLLLIKEFDSRVRKYLPTANEQVFYHGRQWNYQRRESEGYSSQSGTLELRSTEYRLDLKRILANDLGILSEFIRSLSDKQEKQFLHTIVHEMGLLADEIGNVTSIPQSGSLADAFLQALASVEMNVDANGNISRPSLFLSPEVLERLHHEIEERGPEFKAQVEAIRREREQQALNREAERLSHYDHPE